MFVIPAIDIIDGKCVRLFRGDYAQKTVYPGSPEEVAAKWEKSGARIIHLVDLDGAKAGKPVNLAAVKAATGAVSIPCELGGGIRTLADAEAAFAAGVARVILGTVACENRPLVADLLARFGPEKVVVGIDAKDGKAAVKGWLENSGMDALELAAGFAAMGVSRFIYTDISRDGALVGPNYAAMAAFCDRVPGAAVIASGGVGEASHVETLAKLGKPNLEAVIVGKALYDGKVSMDQLREYC